MEEIIYIIELSDFCEITFNIKLAVIKWLTFWQQLWRQVKYSESISNLKLKLFSWYTRPQDQKTKNQKKKKPKHQKTKRPKNQKNQKPKNQKTEKPKKHNKAYFLENLNF